MCKYCDNEKMLPTFGSNSNGYIRKGRNKTYYLYIEVMGYITGIENINYCPICGRKLEDIEK